MENVHFYFLFFIHFHIDIYKGQKKGILAEAIKHLVFQAGVYDCFIDVFGGSGAASLAVPRRTQAIYIFNDMDYALCVNGEY